MLGRRIGAASAALVLWGIAGTALAAGSGIPDLRTTEPDGARAPNGRIEIRLPPERTGGDAAAQPSESGDAGAAQGARLPGGLILGTSWQPLSPSYGRSRAAPDYDEPAEGAGDPADGDEEDPDRALPDDAPDGVPSEDEPDEDAARPGAASALFTLGHSAPDFDSMVVPRRYNRRTPALSYTSTDDRIVLRPLVAGAERDADRRRTDEAEPAPQTIGGAAIVRPLARTETLSLQATALSTEEPGGEGQATPLDMVAGGAPGAAAGAGTAGSLRVESAFFDRRLNLAGEFAASDFDVDADGPAKGGAAQAYRFATGWSSHPGGPPAEGGPAWGLELRHEHRDLLFASPAQPYMAKDFIRTEVAGRAVWSGIKAELTLSRRTDNVADDEARPTIRTHRARTDLHWSPVAGGDADAASGPFGRPHFRLTNEVYHDRQVAAPKGSTAHGVDRLGQSAELAARFAYPNWRWGLSHRLAYDRNAKAAAGRLVNATRFNLRVPVVEGVVLSPHLRHEFVDNRVTGVSLDTLNAGLTASMTLVPGTLDWDFGYTYDGRTTSDTSVDTDLHTLETTLNWTVMQPRAWWPGMIFSLRGAYRHDDRRITPPAERNTYRVFGMVSVGLQDAQ